MAVAVPSRLGEVNDDGADDLFLFLKIFGGEVMTLFYNENVTLDKHFVRTIQHGKSAQFPFIDQATASYHTAGAEIVGNVIHHAEQIITVDGLLIADAFVALIDELMNHYDVRQPYSEGLGRAVVEQFDSHVFQMGLLAARSSTVTTNGNGGGVITDGLLDTSADTMVDSLAACQQSFDEKNIPAERWAFLRPAQFWLLHKHDKVQNMDYDGAGSFSQGTVLGIHGLPIVKSNNIPNTNVTADAGGTKYNGNFTTTVALVMNRMAVGTVRLLDLGVEVGYDMRRQGDLMLAKMVVGSNVLRPDCAIELKTS
jgi:hypothetical protein